MKLRTLTASTVVAALLVCLQAAAAFAQDGPAPRRPYRRIFGGAPVRPSSVQQLDVALSAAGTYDDSLLASGEVTGGETPEQGVYPSAGGNLTYRRAIGLTGAFTANVSSAFQYYSQLDDRLDQSHGGGIDLTVPVNPRTTLRVAQTVSWATFSTLLGLPGSVISDPGAGIPGGELLNPGEAYGISDNGGWQFNTHATAARQFGQRNSLEGHFSHSRTDLTDILSTSNEIGARYRYSLSRQAAVVAGYTYQRGHSGIAQTDVIFHDINVGVDYTRRLPGLRNTTVSMATGSTFLRTLTGPEFSFLGDVRLVHLMGRTWSAGAGYHRGLEFVDVLGQAVSADAVTGTLNGFLGPRLESWVSTSYSRGNLGVTDGTPVKSISVIGRVQYALSQKLAVDAQYIYYFHQFDSGAVLPGSVPERLERNAVRAGLTLLLPAVR